MYRFHRAQTGGHARRLEERLEAQPARHPTQQATAAVGGLTVTFEAGADHTPVEEAISAYAFENLEVAVYRALIRLAECCHDGMTARVAREILTEEEEGAELMASTLDQALITALSA